MYIDPLMKFNTINLFKKIVEDYDTFLIILKHNN